MSTLARRAWIPLAAIAAAVLVFSVAQAAARVVIDDFGTFPCTTEACPECVMKASRKYHPTLGWQWDCPSTLACDTGSCAVRTVNHNSTLYTTCGCAAGWNPFGACCTLVHAFGSPNSVSQCTSEIDQDDPCPDTTDHVPCACTMSSAGAPYPDPTQRLFCKCVPDAGGGP